ncbi:unnamed protein product [Mytilus edulis]|uniref:DZIP3-like HEPN domain-containing protein n=1 Tax=Mytilus edulis TaxID=6550 RepID=A0A8S3QK25_MYTED|nr:unnamed protein product [Mytilus edulis]
MIERHSWKRTFVQTFSTFQILLLFVESFIFKCPSQAHWKFRARLKCNSTLKYFCLYNSVEGNYEEGCHGPDYDRKGSKRIYVGYFSRGYCLQMRFQPFLFWTNGTMSDCIFSKSFCSGEGQLVYKEDSTKDDRTCRCDHKKGYSFLKIPRNYCFCIPTEEDCSCYVKSCPVNQTLSTNYSCIQTDIIEKPTHKCKDIIQYNKTVDERIIGCIENNCVSETKNEHFRVDKEQSNVEVHKSSERFRLTKDEVNYLRLIHVLFRVACPVVRMIFNYEIKPNQLRSTLDKNKRKLEQIYRRKEKVLSDYQKTVTSEDFGVRLMIYLLRIIANISVGDLYPVPSDTGISAMLSRIKFIRNELTQSHEGNISDDQFNQYWDDIGQIDFFMLNPINIHTRDVCLFMDMSENYPAMILKQLLSEYCTLKRVTIEDILRNEKHDLYHKRINTKSCCKCSTKQFSTFTKIIPEKQWEAMYEISMSSNSHSCPFHLTKCSESFVPKTTNTSDSSMIMTLLLYSHNMMQYIASRLFVKGFCQFLLDNQHTLYHSMDNNMCSNAIPCKIDTMDCCCQYSVRNGIKHSDIDETVLFKLVYIAGPFSVLNKIKEDAFLYFINWTVDVEPLRRALTELLKIIKDETFRSDMLQRTSSINLSQSYETDAKSDDACEWLSKHLRKQKDTKEPTLQILVRDKDGLRVRRVQIPQDFTFLTEEEESKILDLKLMIYILKENSNEEKKEYVKQLDVIDGIRREIVQSSSGVLNDERFKDIMETFIRYAADPFKRFIYRYIFKTRIHVRSLIYVIPLNRRNKIHSKSTTNFMTI